MMFANRRALDTLRWASTGPWGVFDVHAAVAVHISAPRNQQVRQIRKPAPLRPEKLDDVKTTASETTIETGVPTVQAAELPSLPSPQQPEPTDQDWQQVRGSASKEKDSQKRFNQRVRECMEASFKQHAERLQRFLQIKDPDQYWMLWCSCVEDGYVHARKLTGQEARQVRGMGPSQVRHGGYSP